MRLKYNRKAFSMLTAIVVIVLMASVGAFVMNLSGKMLKTTTTQYQREQAALLAKSYTEYAIMAVMSNNRAGTPNCIDTIRSNNIINPFAQGGYNARIEIAYISNGAAAIPLGDGLNDVNGCTRIFSDAAVTARSSLNIIVDVYVKYKDFDNDNDMNMTYHKRTLQKI